VIAAVVSAAIGQLSKPYTCVLLYGKDFDFKTTFQAGGFPSTHSSVCSLFLLIFPILSSACFGGGYVFLILLLFFVIYSQWWLLLHVLPLKGD
jgi:acid phosphatase family membrane protein YuiD